MNKNIILSNDFTQTFPKLFQGIKKAKDLFDNLNSFEDIERFLLMGAGLSKHTYRSYLQSVKLFYQFAQGKHPLQVIPADIEKYYDTISDRRTAQIRMAGLKNFFLRIEQEIPFFTSPFKMMSKKLLKKISRSKKGNRTKKALTSNEVNRILTWLKSQPGLYWAGNYCLFYMLCTSGLRASELLQLRWKDIEFHEGRYTCRFIGKGNKESEQELYGPTVDACLTYFKSQYHRNPLPGDPIFSCVERFKGDVPGKMSYHSLYYRFRKIYKEAREAGILTRELTFTPHLCRRTYATLLYRSGMGLKAIQQKTRHQSIETLAQHYIYDETPATPYLEKLFSSPRTERRVS